MAQTIEDFLVTISAEGFRVNSVERRANGWFVMLEHRRIGWVTEVSNQPNLLEAMQAAITKLKAPKPAPTPLPTAKATPMQSAASLIDDLF